MPSVPEAVALAFEHHQSGRLPEAEALCHQVLQVAPGHPQALHVLGVIAQSAGRNHQAIGYLEAAVQGSPAAAEMHNSLAEAYRMKGEADRAVHHYEQALSIDPAMAEAHCNLGIVLRLRGNHDEAIAHFQHALRVKPSLAQAHNNLGSAYLDQGKIEEAIAEYRAALARAPDLVEARTNLAIALRSGGRTLDALNLLFEGVAGQPANVLLRSALVDALRGIALGTVGERERSILASLCVDDDISMMQVSHAIVGLLRNFPALPALLRCVKSGADPVAEVPAESKAFASDPLLLTALPRTVIHDPDLERVLTGLRRSILFWTREHAQKTGGEAHLPRAFSCALARQCFYAEYALFVDEEEQPQIEWVDAQVLAALKKPIADPSLLEPLLIAAALYGRLSRFTSWERLLGPMSTSWSPAFQPLIREHLINRRREKEIEGSLPAITAISDEISKVVRQQYEDNPYPLWVSAERQQPVSAADFRQRLRPGEPLPPIAEPVSILVAGCGTGHHPIEVARRFKDCEILAVDLSRSSLAYAARMAEQLQIANIQFQQADILELGKLAQRFSIIECGGVLHHLREPLQGWRSLVRLLAPGGLMKIALYSRTARKGLQVAREFARAGRFDTTPEGIRRCRRAIIDLPDGDPTLEAMTFGDFYSLNGCRDLIMHVQEHDMTLPQIRGYLDELGLRFLQMECESWVAKKVRAQPKDPGNLDDLVFWDHFEQANPRAFRKMYQFWCCAR